MAAWSENQKKTMEGFPTIYHSKEDAVKAAVKAVLSYEGDIRHNGLKTDGFVIIRQDVVPFFVVEFIRRTEGGYQRCFAATYERRNDRTSKTEVFKFVNFHKY